MGNDKRERLGIVGTLSELAGALIGGAVLTGKSIEQSVRDMMAARQAPSERGAKEAAQVRTKQKKARKPTPEQKPKRKQVKTKRATQDEERTRPPSQ